jgi:CheY-like chemotaxis protein
MPGMDGLATIEEIRKLNFEMPVILSSGTMDASEGQKFDKLNINSIVEKPYEFETMLSTIQKLI